MIVKVELCTKTQYFRCPTKIGRKVRKLQKDFDRWLYNRNNNHPYWKDEDGNEFYGVCFDAEAFIFWLNNVRFKNGKKVARLIATPNKQPKKRIHF